MEIENKNEYYGLEPKHKNLKGKDPLQNWIVSGAMSPNEGLSGETTSSYSSLVSSSLEVERQRWRKLSKI